MIDEEISFNSARTPIQTTPNRIVSVWYGDVDRLVLERNNQPFTGAAAMFAVYEISSRIQYYVSLFDMKGQLFHTWQCVPCDVRVTDAAAYESKVIERFKQQGVSFQPVSKTTNTFDVILKKLPIMPEISDKTPNVGEFKPQPLDALGLDSKLSPTDRNTIKAFIALY